MVIFWSVLGDLTLKLIQNPGPVSVTEKLSYPDRVDINFNVSSSEIIKNQLVHKKCGRTLIVEDDRYQKEIRSVCVMLKDVPATLTMKANEFSTVWTHIMTVDETSEAAKAEMADCESPLYVSEF